MQIPVIKKIVEQYTTEQLQLAEQNLYNGESLSITIEGEDEGEQLTHILAALFIQQHIKENESGYSAALRAYTEKVRNSIG